MRAVLVAMAVMAGAMTPGLAIEMDPSLRGLIRREAVCTPEGGYLDFRKEALCVVTCKTFEVGVSAWYSGYQRRSQTHFGGTELPAYGQAQITWSRLNRVWSIAKALSRDNDGSRQTELRLGILCLPLVPPA